MNRKTVDPMGSHGHDRSQTRPCRCQNYRHHQSVWSPVCEVEIHGSSQTGKQYQGSNSIVRCSYWWKGLSGQIGCPTYSWQPGSREVPWSPAAVAHLGFPNERHIHIVYHGIYISRTGGLYAIG